MEKFNGGSHAGRTKGMHCDLRKGMKDFIKERPDLFLFENCLCLPVRTVVYKEKTVIERKFLRSFGQLVISRSLTK